MLFMVEPYRISSYTPFFFLELFSCFMFAQFSMCLSLIYPQPFNQLCQLPLNMFKHIECLMHFLPFIFRKTSLPEPGDLPLSEYLAQAHEDTKQLFISSLLKLRGLSRSPKSWRILELSKRPRWQLSNNDNNKKKIWRKQKLCKKKEIAINFSNK